MQCFMGCVMLNKFGVCESAMRRPERIKDCPHRKMSLKVSLINKKDNIFRGESNGKYKT